ncbi:MAG: PxKF domain-containing protein [Nocardioidaceae bacterium]|nr:PxKF domain-containing protein [Nocardioidaceae bacterium]
MHVLSSPRSRFLALLAAAALALVGLTAAPASADAPSVTISPTSAAPSTITSFTVTVTATATSSAAQTLSITVPAGFSSPSLDSWTKPGPSWTVAGPVSGTWTFSGPSNEKLNSSNPTLVAHVTAVTPAAGGPYTWTVGGTTNGTNTISGFTSPVVTVGSVVQDQTITFPAIDPQVYGTGPLALTATASSGLPVSYTTTGPCTATGSSLSFDGAGSCSVTAHQAGNASYHAAPDVTRTFTIAQAPQTITFDPIDTQVYGSGPLTLVATGGDSGNPVTFTASGACSVTGDQLALDAAGSCTVTAHQAGNANYLDAPDVPRTFSITKAHAVLSLSNLAHTYDGLPHGATVTTNPAGLGTVTVTYDGSSTVPTDAGSYAVHATLDNPNYEADPVDGTLVIAPKHVTGSFTVDDKTYDGNANATIATCEVAGIEDGDDVTLDCSGATFDGANAGAHTATLSSASLTGPDAANYVLDGVGTASGTINAKTVTATLQAGDKVYDGNDIASATATLSGVVAGDELLVSAVVDAAHFSDENADTGKTVTATVHLEGTAAGNYTLASTTVTDTANINPLHITGTFTAQSKVYDGFASATVTGRDLVGAIAGDDVYLTGGTAAFSDESATPGKTVTLSGATLGGTDAGNYVLDSVATTTADITPLALTASFTAADKQWDGTTDATILTRTLATPVAGDDVTLGTSGTAHFDTAAVGTGKTVTATGFALSGADAGNYTLAPGPWTTTASISPLYTGKGFYQPVDMTPAGGPRVYNSIKGGQTVPLKFDIFNAVTGVEQTTLAVFGSDPTAAFKVSKIACTATSTPDDAIEMVSTGATSLRYDTSGGQYIQNWKTPTGAGTCYAVSVSTVDGTTVGPAYFKITK